MKYKIEISTDSEAVMGAICDLDKTFDEHGASIKALTPETKKLLVSFWER